ncbi:MAG: hypothetical protein MZV70_23010 [Desulfobacterales bacterium]|nr:hypothetical protein [Desulfobacterales bacterium]
MLDSVTILEKIIIDPPAAKIYSRLGFKKRLRHFPPLAKKKQIVISKKQPQSSGCKVPSCVFLSVKMTGRIFLLTNGQSSAAKNFPFFLTAAGKPC